MIECDSLKWCKNFHLNSEWFYYYRLLKTNCVMRQIMIKQKTFYSYKKDEKMKKKTWRMNSISNRKERSISTQRARAHTHTDYGWQNSFSVEWSVDILSLIEINPLHSQSIYCSWKEWQPKAVKATIKKKKITPTTTLNWQHQFIIS